MSPRCLLMALLFATSYCIEGDIPSSFTSTKAMKSLFCNTCAVLSSMVNETLHEKTADFETLVGFRLDSNGKKIRKESEWLKLFLSLEDVCEDWKEKYRVAKRKDGSLYLMEEREISTLRRAENQKKRKLEDEIKQRLNAKWAAEWEIEREQKQRIYNETHDDEGNLIESETEHNDDAETAAVDGDDDAAADEDDDDDGGDGGDGAAVSDEEVIGNRYYFEHKPKVLKKKDKPHRRMKEMCFLLSERFDEWLHSQQKVMAQTMAEGETLDDHLEPISFCLEDGLCSQSMFSRKPKIFKFKKELKIPKKPKRTFVPIQERIPDDYDEEMEDDNDDDDGERRGAADDVDPLDDDGNDGAGDDANDDGKDKAEL